MFMKAKHLFLALGAVAVFPTAAMAGSGPQCFTSMATTRFYVVAQDRDDPLAAVASPQARAVRVYEYNDNRFGTSAQRMQLQGALRGVARYTATGELDSLTAGDVSGANNFNLGA